MASRREQDRTEGREVRERLPAPLEALLTSGERPEGEALRRALRAWRGASP